MLQSSRGEEAARTCIRGVAGKSQRRRKGQSSRKSKEASAWRRCGGVAWTGVAVEASRGVTEASQYQFYKRHEHEHDLKCEEDPVLEQKQRLQEYSRQDWAPFGDLFRYYAAVLACPRQA